MMLATTDRGISRAEPGLPGACPSCAEPVIAKCGRIVAWHWAHRAGDCDPWSEPESQWHLGWKAAAARTEVVISRAGHIHRADIITPTGWVVELQSSFLPVDEIAEREAFYGRRMVWLYNASRWADRLHFGRKGFWWKHGAKSLAAHRRTVYWHLPDTGEVWRTRVSVIDRRECIDVGPNGPSYISTGKRVLGKRLATQSEDAFKAWIGWKQDR